MVVWVGDSANVVDITVGWATHDPDDAPVILVYSPKRRSLVPAFLLGVCTTLDRTICSRRSSGRGVHCADQ